MVIDGCVSEVTCGTLEKVPSVGFVDASTKRASVCEYGEDCASALDGSGARMLFTECDSFCNR